MKNKIVVILISLGILSLAISFFYHGFNLNSNINSAKPQKEISDTINNAELTAKLTFGGDVLLHTNTFGACKISEDKYDFNPVFELIKPYFDSDFKILNMEGIVDAVGNNKNLDGYPRFNSPIEIAEAIKNLSVNMLVTANNHAFDKGYTGIENNLKNLKSKGLGTLGTYIDEQSFEETKIVDVNGIKIGFIAYTDSVNGLEPVIPKEKLGFVVKRFSSSNFSYIDKIYKDIDKLKEKSTDIIVVSLHWGTEYQDKPSKMQIEIAQALVDYGADIIMGNHSHCVQPIKLRETIKKNKKRNALIIYSLGNFFADQAFSDHYYNQKTKRSMIVNVTIKKVDNEITLENMNYIPTYLLRDGKYATCSSKYGYRIISPGKYIDKNNRPDIFSTDLNWENCKKAYEHVSNIVGNDIECCS